MTASKKDAFTARDAANAWDVAADAWDEFVESGEDYYRGEVHGPALLDACGNVDGLRVLDLGCGQGYFSRELAKRGASVIGVDLSEKQVAYARRHEQQETLGVEYRVLAAERIANEFSAGDFDLVAACMSVHDMPDEAAVLRATAALLTGGQRFVFSVPHPLGDMPYREWERGPGGEKLFLKVDRYFETGPGEVNWNMPRLKYSWKSPMWRRTLGEHSELIADADFLIRRIYEPRPTPEQVERVPDLDDCYRLPYFLIFDCVRPQP